MIKNDTRKSKTEPPYEGPFKVVRRTAGGSYKIQGPEGTLYRRPPSAMKLVMGEMSAKPGLIATVKTILDHRLDKSTNATHYLVQWKNLSSNLNSWIPESDFIDHQPIRQYLNNLDQARNGTTKRESIVSKRKADDHSNDEAIHEKELNPTTQPSYWDPATDKDQRSIIKRRNK